MNQEAAPDPGLTDLEIVGAAQQGDYSGFEELVRRYQDRVYRLALSITRAPSDAEEVAQEVFLNVFRHLSSFRGQSAPGSWIYRIAANSALMRVRGKKRHPEMSIEDRPAAWKDDGKVWITPPGEWSWQPDQKLLSQELSQKVNLAIDRLPESYRVVLILRDVEGLSSEETAETLGITVPTVKSRLHRSRLFVREELESYFDDK